MSKRMFRLGAVTSFVLGVVLLVPQTAPRSTPLLLLGAVLVVVGGALGWHQVRDGQVIDRYRRAVEDLGSDQAEVRLGGLHSLDEIAKDSVRSRLLVDDTIGDFLRERSPWTAAEQSPGVAGSPAPDVETAVAMLTRRPGASIDLSHVDLRGADLGKLQLAGAVFRRANLAGARLLGTRLDEGVLDAADLRDADLRGASLRKASLRVACLEGADLRAADLTDADLRGADMRAVNLDKAVLTGARVNRGTLWPPDFTPARVSASLFSD
ncbi:pentapeptide repeat-containing protein [Lentzea californiensis]|uniref:pentapeptide repeat-containing protein n=1 Tax=Lentzea californiensis TaxID=438851 RepID=UPI002164B8B1|nr:pentapeptide repeat-containing protein [Lentzea californiensis]